MRDFLRFDQQKWIPESALNIFPILELTILAPSPWRNALPSFYIYEAESMYSCL
jgi:hypothetical protein